MLNGLEVAENCLALNESEIAVNSQLKTNQYIATISAFSTFVEISFFIHIEFSSLCIVFHPTLQALWTETKTWLKQTIKM